MSVPRLIVGAHLVCYVNSRLFAEIAGIQYTSDTPRIARKGIDTLQVVEYVPTGGAVTGTLIVYRRRQAGGIEAAGMVATYPDLAREKYFTVTLIDRATDTVAFQAEGCVVTAQSWTAGKEHMKGQVSFLGKLASNETQPDQ